MVGKSLFSTIYFACSFYKVKQQNFFISELTQITHFWYNCSCVIMIERGGHMAETVLAGRVSRILEGSGKNKADFARSLGISRNYLYALLSGKKTNCSQTLALLIEQKYGYPAEWVLTGEVSSDNPVKEIVDKIQGLDKETMKRVSTFLDGLKGDSKT